MALQTCGLNLNRAAKELQPHGSIAFPCAGYSLSCPGAAESNIPWHWHEEMEIAYIAQGQAEVKAASSSFLLSQGDLVIINSNILHSGTAAAKCQMNSLVFSPALITGSNDSAFAQKYILPLLSCGCFSGYQVCASDRDMAANWFNQAFAALAEETWGFEFAVRENLSHLCLYLYEMLQQQLKVKTPPSSHDNLRIRKMLDYIHQNFPYDISLAEISGAADISQRECLRCFQRLLQISPVQYLLKYRVMQGAEMLLEHPTSSISEIAARCGFDSPSNFAKIFKRFFTCTPREYRKENVKS